MTKVVYEIVEHDGGWAYRSDGVYSETFRTHDDARAAAVRASREQKVPGSEAAILLAFLIGAIQLAISLVRLGDLTRYISHSVIVGFTAGASLLLVLDQWKNLVGQRALGGVHDHFLVRFWRSLTEGGPMHLPTLAVGAGSIALVLLLRVVKRRIGWPLLPEFLIVVAVGGLGGVSGVFWAALLIGVLDFALKKYVPSGGTAFIYALTILLLLWRPQGLFGTKST